MFINGEIDVWLKTRIPSWGQEHPVSCTNGMKDRLQVRQQRQRNHLLCPDLKSLLFFVWIDYVWRKLRGIMYGMGHQDQGEWEGFVRSSSVLPDNQRIASDPLFSPLIPFIWSVLGRFISCLAENPSQENMPPWSLNCWRVSYAYPIMSALCWHLKKSDWHILSVDVLGRSALSHSSLSSLDQ